jgi:DNA-binding response OmpR family regulator
MNLTITQKSVENAAKEYSNQNVDKTWQDALDIFKWMSDYLIKENNKSSINFNFDKRIIISNGVEYTVPRKKFNLAYFLYQKIGRYVSREEILDNVWSGIYVDDRTIDVHVCLLKRTIPNIPIKSTLGCGYGWFEK